MPCEQSKNLKRALDEQKKAEQSAKVAREQENQAKAAKAQADQERRNSERLRYQAIAQSMAIKAKAIVPDDRPIAELKGVVALQAFFFYQKNKDSG